MTYTIPSYTVQPGSVYQPKSGFPLDFLKTNVVGCWSTRQLLSTGSGNIIRGRDATTNEEDFTGSGYPDGVVTLASGGDAFCPQLYDQSGNANHATQVVAANQPKLVDTGSLIVDASGRPVMEFDGAGDSLAAADSSFANFGNGLSDSAFSMGFWFKNLSGAPNGSVFGKSTAAANGEYYLFITGSVMYWRLVDESAGGYISCNAALPVVDTYIILTYDGSGTFDGMKRYDNGVLKTTTGALTGSYTAMETTAKKFTIGGGVGSLDGTINDICIFNKALTQSEVTQLHNALAL